MTATTAGQHREVDAFLGSILGGERAGALRIAREAFTAGGAPYLFDAIIQPAMQLVGSLWHQNKISVADEHAATAIAQSAVASLYPEFPWSIGGPRAIVACGPGERHEFGARMVADVLALNGWDASFLGADTPTAALVKMAQKIGPVFVALSVGLPANLPAARQTVIALKNTVGCKVLIGGRAVARLTDPGTRLGVDAVALSSSAAIETAAAWKP